MDSPRQEMMQGILDYVGDEGDIARHVQIEETSPQRCNKSVTGKSEDSHATEALWMERRKLGRWVPLNPERVNIYVGGII